MDLDAQKQSRGCDDIEKGELLLVTLQIPIIKAKMDQSYHYHVDSRTFVEI